MRRRAIYGYNLGGTQSKSSVYLGKFYGEPAGFGRFEGHRVSGKAPAGHLLERQRSLQKYIAMDGRERRKS